MKNAPSLSVSAKHSKNSMLTGTMWNIIDSNGMSKVINPMDAILPIPNINLVDLAMFLWG